MTRFIGIVRTPEQLHASPRLGASWEGFALDCVCRTLDKEEGGLYFRQTHAGADMRKVLNKGGTGRGLSVIWGALKDHNGYIDVTSDPGKGTIFTLYFPAGVMRP